MKTVKVRIAVAIDSKGEWCANGGSNIDDDQSMHWCLNDVGEDPSRYFVTAEIPVPENREVGGRVEVAS